MKCFTFTAALLAAALIAGTSAGLVTEAESAAATSVKDVGEGAPEFGGDDKSCAECHRLGVQCMWCSRAN
ncbi:hypothetical protein Pst134EB_008857 [Puccinia striiformis f. sp. tritici]|nr:hypothetical protein Pst134EB_008857 [Puccinia striiformis f. sp. tritici]